MTRSVGLVLVAASVLITCTPLMPPPPSDRALIAGRVATPRGAKIFNLRCASCHGERGNAPGVAAVMGPGALRRFADTESLCAFIASRMPPGARRLETRDAKAVCAYVAAVSRWEVASAASAAASGGAFQAGARPR